MLNFSYFQFSVQPLLCPLKLRLQAQNLVHVTALLFLHVCNVLINKVSQLSQSTFEDVFHR